MKVLVVVEHFYPYIGGAEELFLNLATSLVENGDKVTVICTRHAKDLAREESFNGINIHRVNCKNRFLFTFQSLPLIMRLARSSDVIHTTSYNAALPAWIGAKLLNKKIIITFHEVWGKLWFRLPFYSIFHRTLFYLFEQFILCLPFNKFIAVSKFTKRELVSNNIPENLIEVIYNGLDYNRLAPFTYTPPEKFTICFYGRLGISKGLDILIPAASSFARECDQVIFKLIIPTYPERIYQKVLKLIRDYNLEKNVVLLHNLKRFSLLTEVTTSSCVVIPSYSEGFGFVAAECAAMEVPVISSGKGSLPEVTGGKVIQLKTLTAFDLCEAFKEAMSGKWEDRSPARFSLSDTMKKYRAEYMAMVE